MKQRALLIRYPLYEGQDLLFGTFLIREFKCIYIALGGKPKFVQVVSISHCSRSHFPILKASLGLRMLEATSSANDIAIGSSYLNAPPAASDVLILKFYIFLLLRIPT